MTNYEELEQRVSALELRVPTEAEGGELEQRVAALEMKMPTMEDGLRHNTEITMAVKEDTADLVAFVSALGGLITFIKWVGRILQWLSPIALVVVSAWAAVKGIKQV